MSAPDPIAAYKDPARARQIASAIRGEVRVRDYALMEFCGGHTHAICRYGLEDLLPANVRMIHGPGCPVCVLPVGRLDMAIQLALIPGVILASYGDMMRVPASGGLSLMKAKAQGADVRMVYSTAQAVALAEANPNKQVVLFAIGFETTTPPTAAALHAARAKGLSNFSVFCNHVLTPAAIDAIMATSSADELKIDGFVGPGHVSMVIGAEAYQPAVEKYGRPIAIAGFEPVDVLEAIYYLVRRINAGEAGIDNGYGRAVPSGGNLAAQQHCEAAFALRDDFEWRGLGRIPHSALKLSPAFAMFDAETRFAVKEVRAADHKACQCAQVLRGAIRPEECKVFASACTPETPLGSCMVSSEGACAAHYLYGRMRTHA